MATPRTIVALAALTVCISTGHAQAVLKPVLKPADYAHYVDKFRIEERAATGTEYPGEGAEPEWAWMQREIPWFDSSDKAFEEMYYFRWYAWKKHLVATPTFGFLITEWLPKPDFKGGTFGVLNDAAPFHLGEARWLHNPKIAEDYARFWYTDAANPHNYSAWMNTAVRAVTLANGDRALASTLLPVMIANYHAWESTQQDANGLFWSIDTRDAMEKSISGDGYRPTLNSYLVAEARTIAAIAQDPAIQQQYTAKADKLAALIEANLWNPKDQFYEVMSPSKDSGIRKQKKFIDNGTSLQIANAREQIGFIPWQFGLPPAAHAVAWKQMFDPEGFDGKFGLTTVERRSPRFRFESNDQCTWNGPTWPFAMTQTLTALAAYEQAPGGPPVVGRDDYLKLFSKYVLSQHLTLKDGKVIDWIDEDLDADTDDWIAKRMLAAKNNQVGRGNYYNHSGFTDPLVTGLIGLQPRADDHVVINPLLPAGAWSYFAIDQLPYHGHTLAILWDATGKRYHHGAGMTLLIDGKPAAQRRTLGKLEAELPGAKP